MPTESDFASLRKQNANDMKAVRAEIDAFKLDVEQRSSSFHTLTDRQRATLVVVLNWAIWLADGGKLMRGLIGVAVLVAAGYTAARALWEGVLK